MAKQLQGYRELMDIRVALDLGIAAYRKLIDSEDTTRLIIRSLQSSALHGTPMHSSKRKRTALEESEESSVPNFHVTSYAKGEVEISDVCSDGKFVRLHNKGNKVS
jgi:lamin B